MVQEHVLKFVEKIMWMLNNKHEKVILKRNLCTNLSQKLTEI